MRMRIMKIYSQWGNVRVHMSILPPHVYSTSIFTSICLLHVHVSFYIWTLTAAALRQSVRIVFLLMNRTFGVWIFFFPVIVLHENQQANEDHENLFTVGKRTSPHLYSTSTCLPYLHMSILLLHIYSTSTCLLYIHMSTLSLYVYPSFTYLIHFRTLVEFENENTFALEPSQQLLYGWACELSFLLMNRTFGVWIFFFSVIVLHENQKANEDSWKFIHSGETYESTSLLYLHMSTLPLQVYSTPICLLYPHMSTLPPYVYSTSTCLLYLHMSTIPPHVYSTSTSLLYIHMPTSSLYVYPSFTYLIHFRTLVEFENENTFAPEPSQQLLYGWACELCFLLMNRFFGVWIFFFSVIVLHENQKANEDSWKFIHSGETYESTCLSTLPPRVYSTSTCPLYLHMSTLPPHVYTTSTCLLISICLL